MKMNNIGKLLMLSLLASCSANIFAGGAVEPVDPWQGISNMFERIVPIEDALIAYRALMAEKAVQFDNHAAKFAEIKALRNEVFSGIQARYVELQAALDGYNIEKAADTERLDLEIRDLQSQLVSLQASAQQQIDALSSEITNKSVDYNVLQVDLNTLRELNQTRVDEVLQQIDTVLANYDAMKIEQNEFVDKLNTFIADTLLFQTNDKNDLTNLINSIDPVEVVEEVVETVTEEVDSATESLPDGSEIISEDIVVDPTQVLKKRSRARTQVKKTSKRNSGCSKCGC